MNKTCCECQIFPLMRLKKQILRKEVKKEVLCFIFDFKIMSTKKTVIITGGSSGIGAKTALLFAEQGANIVITYKKN